jgi:hypothetical protein
MSYSQQTEAIAKWINDEAEEYADVLLARGFTLRQAVICAYTKGAMEGSRIANNIHNEIPWTTPSPSK